MFIIFGLGNPGPQYHGTRHNAGFELVDLIADAADIDINRNKFKAMVGEGFFAGKKVVLIKPMTYMNLSGEAVVAALNFYKPAPDEWMVAYDDMDLKPGAVRVREKGSSGGHNGMKSIIALTGTDEFIRLRIGVGGARGNVISHVLGKFTEAEEKPYTEGLLLAREAVRTILSGRVEDAMSQVNSSGKPPKKPRTPRREKTDEANGQSAAPDAGIAEKTPGVDQSAAVSPAAPETTPAARETTSAAPERITAEDCAERPGERS